MLTNIQLGENARWKQRFRAPIVAWTQIALANRTRGLVATNISGKFQLHTWDVRYGKLHQFTNRAAGTLFGAISGDGRYIYFLDDEQGNEIGHYVRLPYDGGDPQDLTPDWPAYSTLAFSSSGSGSHFGFTAADSEGFHIHSVETKTNGEIHAPRQLFHSHKIMLGPTYSFGGEVAIVATTDHTTLQHYKLRSFDIASGAQIAELWDGAGISLNVVEFSPQPGDLRMAGTTNRTGVKRPFIWNPRTNERIDPDLPNLIGEVVPLDWSPDANSLLLCQFTQAIQQLYLYDLTTQALTKLNHPGGTYGFFANSGTYFGSGEEIFAQWQDATHPSQLIALDARTGEKTRKLLAAGEVPAGRPWKSITFPASDGQIIQGWLGLPEGDGPFPTILHTHGGPEVVATELFGPGSQTWLDHGFAYLTINYRGSTTFGREFQEKIWGNVGYWEIEDMVAAHDWLVTSGIANSGEILLTGWSYGGYLTLHGLGKRPDLWAGGMAGVAIADWVLEYEDQAEAFRGYAHALFGGVPEEKPEQYVNASPITYAEAVRAPVLIIQGRNDTRCPARQVEVYEARLKAIGKAIEVHWFDAGHMGAGIERDIQNHEIMLKFAYRVLV